MAICLDEFQQLSQFNGGSVENAIRNQVQKQREVGYVFAGCSYRKFNLTCSSGFLRALLFPAPRYSVLSVERLLVERIPSRPPHRGEQSHRVMLGMERGGGLPVIIDASSCVLA